MLRSSHGRLALLFATSLALPLPAQTWWSLRPLTDPAVPDTKTKWTRGAIDAFVLRKLRANGLTPSLEAARLTLIRRLCFDLHGLPPRPEDIDAFVADRRPDAYERLVDRLLASPHFGERWARHWLDVVHYGETHGYDKDKLRRHAWPYRDYVIRAFNTDKPYARFVKEQLAGDVLYPDHEDGVVATGFIAAGPWDFVGHVELREGTVDKKITRSLDRDDMVRNAMSTFVSTTAHCARCHDHKFDPIPQRDYYRLQAVFAGVERADRPYPHSRVGQMRKWTQASVDQLEQRQDELRSRARTTAGERLAVLEREIGSTRKRLATTHVTARDTKSRSLGYHSKIERTPTHKKWAQIDLGVARVIDGVTLLPAHVKYGGHDGPGFGFPPRFIIEVSNDPEFGAATILLDARTEDFPHPGDAPVAVPGHGTRARFVRVTATRLWKRTSDWIFALGEMVVWSGEKNIAAGRPVHALDSIEAHPSWSKPNLTDGHSSLGRLVPDERLHVMHTDALAWHTAFVQRRVLLLASLPRLLREELEKIEVHSLPEMRSQLDALPPDPLVYAAASSFRAQGNFRPPKGTRPIHILDRGDVKRPKQGVGPGALAAIPALSHHFEAEGLDFKSEGSRRASLALWITDAENPLTWRSIVNRVWQYHFGQGLVLSPSDFGRMGSKPSHPELLDWLARTFRDGGGSLKRLHKRIVMSATYRQSSRSRPDAANRDAGNRLLWRMNRRRLEAESLRDSVLAVAGRLDLTRGGPSVMHFGFKDDHSPHYDYAALDVDSKASRRRSIYRWIVRSVPDPFLERMDCPDASLATPVRFTTITAPQALSLLNHRFMVRHSEHFAARVDAHSTELDARIVYACRLALGRPPGDREQRSLRDLATRHGLRAVCRALLNTNEFLFID